MQIREFGTRNVFLSGWALWKCTWMLNEYIHQLYDFYPQDTPVMLSDFSHLYANSAPCCHPSLLCRWRFVAGHAFEGGGYVKSGVGRVEKSIIQHVAKKRKQGSVSTRFLLDQILFPWHFLSYIYTHRNIYIYTIRMHMWHSHRSFQGKMMAWCYTWQVCFLNDTPMQRRRLREVGAGWNTQTLGRPPSQ